MKKLIALCRRSLRFQALVLALLMPGLAMFPAQLAANPTGGVVTHGAVEIGDGLNGHLMINQLSHKAIINWDDFSISAGEVTQFLQPSGDAAALNRVVSGNPSAIHGALQANGKIFVINPNGILVGSTGSIDVGGLVLSTLDVSDAEFLAGGDMIFRGNSGAGVQNFGRINAIGGDVFLLGNTVTNAGSIKASGTVGLAGGEEVLITANPDANGERVFVRPVGGGSVTNSGSIEGAAVELKAHGNLYAMAINNSGSIRATGAARSGGGVYLRAAGGRVDNTGTIRATLPGGNGGRILIEGAIVNAGGTIDASGIGQGKGGEVTLSGEQISVTGRVAADGSSGGTVAIGGPGSTVSVASGAQISANGHSADGGSVAISGVAVNVAGGSLIEANGATNAGSVLVDGTTGSNAFGGAINAIGGLEGGSVRIVGDAINVAESARVDVSGDLGGGTIEIGGGIGGRDPEIINATSVVISDGAKLTADALVAGNGGKIIVWSDGDTTYAGDIRALGASGGRGGFAEVSGRQLLNIDGGEFELGEGGFLLLDPSNFTVTDTVRNAILPTLNAGTDVVIFTNGSDAGAGNGDIIMSSNFSGTSAIAGNGSLSLLAYGDIFLRRDLVSNGAGNLNFVAGWDGVTPSTFGPSATGSDTSGAPVIDMDAQIFADTSTYGNGAGSVYIGLETDKTTPVNQSTTVVGSRAGQTNVAGHDLVMVGDNTATGTGDNRYTILGYRPSDVDASLVREAATGRIKVNVLNDVTLKAGERVNATESSSATPGQYNFVQIGHGGRDAADNGYNHSGDIVVQAGLGTGPGITGNITATAGKNLATFVHIGHGGHGGGASAGSFSGDITVEAGENGSVEFTAGAGRRAYAQIGHGGYDVDAGVTVTDSIGYHSGNITVRAGTDIEFYGGVGATDFVTDSGSYAMIGHGGYGSQSRSSVQGHMGEIVVEAGTGGTSGGILFKSGDIDNNFTQIGHGGRSSNSGTDANGHEGNISVSSLGDITFLAGTGASYRGDADGQIYTQLGHGGWDAGVNLNVLLPAGATQGHHGDISVLSSTGHISFLGGDVNLGSSGDGRGRLHYAQLGHGGYSSEGNHYGNIDVRAGVAADGTLLNAASEVRFSGGASDDNTLETYNYAQLGHGGAFARGNHGWGDHDGDGQADGNITVLSGGDIRLTGGKFFDSTTTTGRDESRRSYVQVGHGGFDADAANPGNDAASILMPDGNSYFFDGYGVGGPTAAERLGNQGDIYIETIDGNVRMRAGQTYDSYGIVGHGGGTSGGSTDGDNTGNITVLADVDGSNRAGGGGNIYFRVNDPNDPDLTDNIYDRRYVQLGHGGHYVSGGHSGDLVVAAGNVIEFRAGGGDSYAQLGHGGRNEHRLNIARVTATSSDDRDTDARYDTVGVSNQTPPDDRRDNGNDRYYAGTHTGDISVTSWGNIDFIGYSNPDTNQGGLGYAQLGHGGLRNAADPLSANGLGHNGDITVLAGGLSFGGNGLITAAENVNAKITFESGMQSFSYAQLGHGGYEAFGNHSGDITVAAAAGIDFHARGGSDTFTDNRAGTYSYVQLGHGGINAEYAPYLPRALESTNNTTGNVFSENPANNPYYAYVTSGGFLPEAGTIDFDGDTLPDPIGQGSLMPLTTFNQIYVDPSTIRFVDHDLDPQTPMIPIIPTNRNQWFHINAPGAPVDGNGNYILGNSGDISVVSLTGDINLQSATSNSLRAREEYVMIGHGGLYTGGDHTGDISVIAQDGNVNMLASQATTGEQAFNGFVQIGHGGSWSGGTMSGDITVAARGAGHSITAIAGSDNQSYVQIGHGGYDASFLSGAANQISGPDANGVSQSDTRAATSTEVRGHNLAYWYNPGFIRRTDYLSEFGDNAATAGAGIEFRRTLSGDIHVEATNGITFAATTAGSTSSNAAPGAYAQIGHGGRSTEADTTGDIFVDAGEGAALFHGGASNQAYVQLGHGGYESDGNKSGSIELKSGIGTNGEGVEFRAGSRPDAYAMLGHGGTGANSALRDDANPTVPIFQGNQGNIKVTTVGDITFVAGTGDFVNSDEDSRNFVQLGHGGYDADVHFTTTTDMFGTGIGHNGDITVRTEGGRIFFAAGDVNRVDNPSPGIGEGRFHFAHLGHGGYEARGEHYGNIEVFAGGGDIIFLGGSSEDNDADRYNFAQLGHGGGISRGNHGRAGEFIDVYSNGDIVFSSGSSQASYSQLGHGGAFARGDHQGDIWVAAEGDIRFSGVMGRHIVKDEEKNSDLSRATNNGTQTGDNLYTLEGSNVIPLTLTITIPGGPVLNDDGNGNIVVAGGNLDLDGDTVDDLAIGQVVASIVYTSGLLTFNTDVNPNNVATPSAALITTASYESLEIATSYTQLGHGGYDSENGTNLTVGNLGNIGIDAGGDVVFQAGVGTGAYAQVGHGGYASPGRNVGNITFGTNRDGIDGTADDRIGGAISFTGGRGEYSAATNAYAKIGHGGRDSSGTNTGDITLRSTTGLAGELAGVGVQMQAGSREDASAQIGHGGVNGNSGLGNGAANMEGHSGDIFIDTYGSVNLIAGVLNMAGSPLTSLNTDGRLFAMIGHGGYDADTSLDGALGFGTIGHNGDITVISREGNVNVLAGDETRAFLPSFAPTSSPFDVIGIGMPLAGGRFHWAQIGHGGYAASGNHYGNIRVHAGFDENAIATGSGNSDVILMGGRNGADDDSGQGYAQIGHGGRSANGNQGRADEVVSVMAHGDVVLQGGDGTDAYAKIGNGGSFARGDREGTIQVFAENNVSVTASQFPADILPGEGFTGRYYYNATSANNNRYSLDRAVDLVAGDGQVAGGALFRLDRISAGSVVFEIYDDAGNKIGEVSDPDGDGSLTVVADFSADMDGDTIPETFVAGQVVGTFNYAPNATRVDFIVDINPGADGGAPNILANFEYARTDRSLAQIGHGGYDADNPDNNVTLGDRGDILVTARTGSISGQAGTDSRSYVQFGHGGWTTRGASSGDIILRAGGDFSLTGGTGGSVDDDKALYAMVGHGGWDSDGTSSTGSGHSGNIMVSSGSGALATAGVGDGLGDFADLGDFDLDGIADVINFGADVSGNAGGIGSGVGILLQGGSGIVNDDDAFAMIGHGGRSSDGAHNGNIGVAATQGISLLGGTAYRSFAQIGHGGLASNGNLSGDISVISTEGNLVVSTGTGTEAYAMIGHGDDRVTDATLNSTGTRTGDILVQVNDWSISGNATTVGQIGHRSRNANAGLVEPTNLQLIATGLGGSVNSLTSLIRDASVLPYLNSGGNVVFGGINLAIDTPVSYTSAGNLTFLSTQGTTFNQSVTNAGTGAVNVLAGWDRVSGFDQILNFGDHPPFHVFDYATLKADLDGGGVADWFGAAPSGDLGWITLDATVGPLSVGSRNGQTNLASYGVMLQGGDGTGEYAQVGTNNSGTNGANGGIDIDAKEGGVNLLGGSATRAFAQVGHGGADGNLTDTDANQRGAISIDVTHGTDPGAIVLQGGTSSEAYAQIGNGGFGQAGNHGGDISLNADVLSLDGGSAASTYAQIGHSVGGGRGSLDGAISVETATELILQGGNASSAFAQIGHGGWNHVGTKNGDISVLAPSLQLLGGALGGYAQIGSGGFGSGGNINSDVTVNTPGAISLVAGGTDAYALIGGGGGRSTNLSAIDGDVSVTSQSGPISLQGGGVRAFAQIGNGGLEFDGEKYGNVSVYSGGEITLTSGTGEEAYTQIGLGGFDTGAFAFGRVDDVLDVFAAGDIRLLASGLGQNAYAQIGHGGGFAKSTQINGDVVVETLGDLVIAAGAAPFAFAQVGSGGTSSEGLKRGDTFVHAADSVMLTGGAGEDAYAKIGLGDWMRSAPLGVLGGNSGTGNQRGDVQVTAGQDVILTNAMIGGFDPRLTPPVPITALGDTYIGVSRNDPSATGTGVLVGDAQSLIASGPEGLGQLRLYLPTRSSNQLSGTRLNSTVYPGPNLPEPSVQTLDEFVINQVLPDTTLVATPSEHENLADLVQGELRWRDNIDDLDLSADTTNYRTGTWGNYSLYYDTIVVSEAGAPVSGPDWSLPPGPGPGAGAGGAGTPGEGIPGSGEEPGGGIGGEPIVVIPLTPADLQQIAYGLFFQRFGVSGTLRAQNGYLIDDFYQDDEPTNQRKKKQKKGAPSIQYRAVDEDREGWSSNEVFQQSDPEVDVNQRGPEIVE